MLITFLALALTQNVCPITIGVGGDGKLFANRFHGWYETSPRTLESDLRGGCYNDANPHAVTSVTFAIAADAPKPRVHLVLSILEREGWSRDKVNLFP
jgi:hypothetical protein